MNDKKMINKFDSNEVADILVVDDAPESLKLLKGILTEQGYKVRPAISGTDAFEAIEQRKPDLILLDIKMPVMDGFEVCKRLKDSPVTIDIPIIFITSSSKSESIEQGFKLGAVDYINKPVRDEEVLARVSTHLELYKMRQRLEQMVVSRTHALKESENKFRRLIEGLKDEYFFYSHDPDGIFTYVSPSIKQVLGYTVDEFMMHYAEYLTDNLINQKAREYTEQSILGQQQPAYELEIYKKNGKPCWLEVKETPLFDDAGNVTSVEGIAHDITTRKLANEALLTSQQRLEEAQHLGHIGSWELDLKTNQLFWSKEIYHIFGIDPEQFGASYEAFLDMIHPDDRQMVDEVYRKSLYEGECYQVIHRIIRKSDGAICHVFERSKHIFDQTGKVIGSTGTVQDITDQVLAEAKYKEHQQKLQHALQQTVQAISLTIEQRDPYTAGHQRRVSELASAIAEEMGLEQNIIEGVRLGGIIHDIGKIYVPSEILSRPGKLSNEEFALIKAHPKVGYDIVKDVEFPWPVANVIYQHHERLDGSGYPQGLKGDEIILEARVLMVADVVEAMVSHRPYRSGLGIEPALTEIKNNRGKFYDPDVVDSCIRLFTQKDYSLPQY